MKESLSEGPKTVGQSDCRGNSTGTEHYSRDDYGLWQTISGSRKAAQSSLQSSGSAELRDDGLDVWTWVTQQ
jgi:hypothetical protein